MLKYVLALFLAVFVLGCLRPGWASRLGLGRLPGDLRVRLKGREYFFPFATTLLLSLLLGLVARVL
jgi:hypothetical protein